MNPGSLGEKSKRNFWAMQPPHKFQTLTGCSCRRAPTCQIRRHFRTRWWRHWTDESCRRPAAGWRCRCGPRTRNRPRPGCPVSRIPARRGTPDLRTGTGLRPSGSRQLLERWPRTGWHPEVARLGHVTRFSYGRTYSSLKYLILCYSWNYPKKMVFKDECFVSFKGCKIKYN